MSRLNIIGQNMAKSKYANIEIGSSEGLESVVTEISVEAAGFEAEGIVIESVQNVCASLEAIAEEAQASIAEGGLDRLAAGMMEVSVESHLSMVGMSNDATPSLESFGGTGTRVEATQVSVEAIKEKAGQLWDYLVKKFKEVREKVFQWFKKIFSGAAMLKSRAEKVAKNATDKKGTKKDNAEDELKIGGAAKVLYKGAGKVDIPGLAGDVKALKDVCEGIYRGHGKDLAGKVDGVTATLEKAGSLGKEEMEGSDVSKFFSGGKFLGEGIVRLDIEVKGDEYLGGRHFVTTQAEGTPSDMTELKSALDKFGLSYEVKKDGSDKTPEVDTDATYAALKPDAVKAIAENVVVLAEAIIAFEGDYFKFQKTMEKADKAADKAGKNFAKFSLGAPAAAAEKVCKAAYSAVQRANQNPVNSLTAAALASAKGALEVCDKSLGQYD